MGSAELFGGMLGVLVAIAALIVLILWMLLPFALFGLKSRLDRLIELQTINNEISLESSRLIDKLAAEAEDSLRR